MQSVPPELNMVSTVALVAIAGMVLTVGAFVLGALVVVIDGLWGVVQ